MIKLLITIKVEKIIDEHEYLNHYDENFSEEFYASYLKESNNI